MRNLELVMRKHGLVHGLVLKPDTALGLGCTLLWLAIGSLAIPWAPAQAAITWWGDVQPPDPSVWTSSTEGYVGKRGEGGITVDAGSVLWSAKANLAHYRGVAGAATITGSGSKWNSGDLLVGSYGSGTLRVENGHG